MVVRSLFVWLSRVFSVWLLHWCLLTLSGGDVTHCHIVSLRRSPSSNTIKRVWGGDLSPVSCCNIPKHLPFILTHFSPCPSPLFRQGSEKERAQLVPVFVCGWSDHLRASCHSLIMVLLAISTERERERERPGALQSFSVLIFITEQKHIVFRVPQCHSIHVIFIVHFSDMTLGRLFFCAVGWTVN